MPHIIEYGSGPSSEIFWQSFRRIGVTLTYLCECVYLQKKVGNVVFPPGSVVPPKKPGSFEKGGMGIEVSAR